MEYFITITVLVVCALLFTKVEFEALQTVSVLVALAASLYLASLLDLGFIPSVLVILGSFPLLISFFAFLGSPKSSKPNSRVELSDPSISALLDEAITVVNDMLETGLPATVYDSGYNGMILVNVCPMPREYCVQIQMRSIEELRQACARRSNLAGLPHLQEENEKVARFISKYGNCYDARERSYVYHTHSTVRFSNGEKSRQKLQELLRQQIEQKCPLANVMGPTQLYTKNVPR